MKRGWAAVALILIAVALSAAEYLYMDASARTCIEMLNEADEHIMQNEIAEAVSLTERLDHRFESIKGVYDIFLYHGEVLEISASLAALNRYARTGDTADFLASSARIRRVLNSIRHTRIPLWENIL